MIENPEPPVNSPTGISGNATVAELFRQNEIASAQLRALNDTAIVAVTSRRGIITLVNDKFCDISGYRRDELIGKDHRIINSGTHPKSFFTTMWKTILSGNTWRGEICNRAKDGSLYWVDSSIAPCFNHHREITEFFSVRFPITDRKIAVAELLRSNQELEQYAYMASHDLKAPLRNIKIFTQLLKQRLNLAEDSESSQLFDHVIHGTTHMDQLIQDILAYSQIGASREAPVALNLEAIIDELIQGGVLGTEEVHFTRMPLPTINGYKIPVQQLFQNLLQNAAKYRKQKQTPAIRIELREKGDFWHFSVSDNGIGMEAQHLGRLFQPFQRLEVGPEYPGTGIGLAICKKVVELHGGRIWAESEYGMGSQFCFTLKKNL